MMTPNGTVLVADDDHAFREITRRVLIQQGFACDAAASGAEVEQFLRQKEYDLLISDINMPGNENLQLIAGLPQLQAGLPVILITGAPTVDSAARSVGLAVAAYLIKPFTKEDLLEHVRSAVDRYRCFRAVAASRQRFIQASTDLARIEMALRSPSPGTAESSVQAFLDITLQNAAQSLLSLRTVVEGLRAAPGEAAPQWAQSSQPVILLQALWETIAVLEKTKTAFKSKELGQLRKKLEAVVGQRPPEQGNRVLPAEHPGNSPAPGPG